ncbi:hypothetical protein E2C01_029020 [Portunus trituberculatus]|uniref:Uncharacterized protein n=1 Tax=Portunus trituberculatus TaxID=210409 RepID=A0A5B7EQV2_PORTR|nr:hypothetical protein [Portunus trituberculatus]
MQSPSRKKSEMNASKLEIITSTCVMPSSSQASGFSGFSCAAASNNNTEEGRSPASKHRLPSLICKYNLAATPSFTTIPSVGGLACGQRRPSSSNALSRVTCWVRRSNALPSPHWASTRLRRAMLHQLPLFPERNPNLSSTYHH